MRVLEYAFDGTILIHLAVEGGVDEDVIDALEDKGVTQDKLMNALKARIERVNYGRSQA